MKQEKELLLKDLCARLPHGVFVMNEGGDNIVYTEYYHPDIDKCKPYLRPMSSMTEKEAKEFSILYGFKDILSITKITDEYIEVAVDDDFYGTEVGMIWYDEIFSIEIFDWLNAHHFDYRGLIEKGLALETSGDMYKIDYIMKKN